MKRLMLVGLIALVLSCFAQASEENFINALPPEIKEMIVSKVDCSSYKDFYTFLMLGMINKECNAIIDSMASKKWDSFLYYLFNNHCWAILEKMRDYGKPAPTRYTEKFIELFSEYVANYVYQPCSESSQQIIIDSRVVKPERQTSRLLHQIFYKKQRMIPVIQQKLKIISKELYVCEEHQFFQEFIGKSPKKLIVKPFIDNTIDFAHVISKDQCHHYIQSLLSKKSKSYVHIIDCKAHEESSMQTNELMVFQELLAQACIQNNDRALRYIYEYAKEYLLKQQLNQIPFINKVLHSILGNNHCENENILKTLIDDIHQQYTTGKNLVIDQKEYTTYEAFIEYLFKQPLWFSPSFIAYALSIGDQ